MPKRKPRISVDSHEVLFRLQMMNRVENAAIVSVDSGRCKAIGIANYVTWFKEHGLRVEKNEKTHQWEIGADNEPIGQPEPSEKQADDESLEIP